MKSVQKKKTENPIVQQDIKDKNFEKITCYSGRARLAAPELLQFGHPSVETWLKSFHSIPFGRV